ncbi:hypothetical protein ISCGN_018009 [Ixodes scapularis]
MGMSVGAGSHVDGRNGRVPQSIAVVVFIVARRRRDCPTLLRDSSRKQCESVVVARRMEMKARRAEARRRNWRARHHAATTTRKRPLAPPRAVCDQSPTAYIYNTDNGTISMRVKFDASDASAFGQCTTKKARPARDVIVGWMDEAELLNPLNRAAACAT